MKTLLIVAKQGRRPPFYLRFFRQESGSLMVELAVTLMFFFTVIFGSMELCSAAYSYTVLADAANEGLHYAVRNSADQAGAVNTVKSYATSTLHDTSRINVSVTYPDGPSTPPNRVAVSVSYQYVPYVGWILPNPPTMHAYAEGRMVH
jgi:Flp pilus assembly protein TadG